MAKVPIRVNVDHPSMALPPQVRIDYRRLCEIEHTVCCRNIGLVDVDSMSHLLAHLEPCRANKKADEEQLVTDDIEMIDVGSVEIRNS